MSGSARAKGGVTGLAAPVDALFALGLFTIAFALRLAAARWLAAEPVWDGHYYDFGARRIASGFGYADEVTRDGYPMWHPWCHYPVGYSGFLAAFYKLFGPGRGVAHVANALVGALLAVVTFLLGREAVSPGRAKVAGALVALHPGLVLYGALLMTEPLSALLVLGAFLVTIKVAQTERGGALGAVAAGALLLGLAVLVRPQALLCAPFLALGAKRAEASQAPWRRAWRVAASAVVACVVTLLPVLPWTARNCRVMDGCALVSTNAGWNLAIGAFPRATGRFETLRSEDGCRDVSGQVQQDRCWLEYGLASIRRAPGRWLALVPTKLAFTFDHESFAVEYLREARPAAWPEERRVSWRGLTTGFHRLLVAASPLAFVALGGLGGLGRRARFAQLAILSALMVVACVGLAADAPTFWPLVVVACLLPWLPIPGRPDGPPALLMSASLLMTTVLTHAIFFGEDRYHMVATPVLCLLAAAALRAPARAGGPVTGTAVLLPSSREVD